MVAAETKLVKSSTYRVQCTSDPSCFVILLMAIAKRVTLSTLPCGRPSSCTKYSDWEAPLLRRTPGMTGSLQQKLEDFLLDPFHACNLIFLVSILCRKPSLGQRTATVCFFSLNPFSTWHVSWVRASMVDPCFLKPDCSGQRMLFFSRNHISLWFTILSNNLQMQLVSEIGR